MPYTSKEIRLASRPGAGEPQPSDFQLAEVEVTDPQDGEVVVRNTFMSVDPYMRGRMNDVPSYVPPWPLGQACEFNVYHLMKVDSPTALFPIEVEEIA